MTIKTKKIIAYIMASVIFIAAIIELLTFMMSIYDVKNYEFWFQVLSTFVIFIFALKEVYRAFVFKHCIYTKIIGIIFILIQFINLIAYFIKFGFIIYSEFVYPIFLISILTVISLAATRKLFYNKK